MRLIEGGNEGLVEEIRKEDSLWYRVGRHARASVVAKGLSVQPLDHTEAFVFRFTLAASRIMRANAFLGPDVSESAGFVVGRPSDTSIRTHNPRVTNSPFCHGLLMGKKYGLVVSDTTGTFPGDTGNPERMAFIFNRDVVERAELVTDLSYDRTEVLRRLFASRKKINTAMDKYAAELERRKRGERKSPPHLKMPEFLAFIRTPFAVAFRIGEYDFLAINAHLHYGHFTSDRRLEGAALADWIVSKVRSQESLNAVLFGDLNLDYDRPASDLKRIIGVAKELRDKGRKGEEQVRVSFPFLFEHPNPGQPKPADSKIFRTNILQSQTYDQIAIFSQDEALGKRLETRHTGHANKAAWASSPTGPDYGVFNFSDLFCVALTGKPFHDVEKATRKELVKKYDFSVSDHMPIWLRMPLT